ncbi:MAG: family 20 glycosylhydrolase [Clostridia bacterium]|nr:family 20 glycosylhydrolase [Clostridia bacterium]
MINIIPTPKSIEDLGDALDLFGICAFADKNTDKRVIKALSSLCREIGEVTGSLVPLSFAKPQGKAITVAHADEGDGYSVSIGSDSIAVKGDGAAGAFYAIQSLRQLVRQNGAALPCCRITDSPDFSYRGFYHDITRGRVPTLEKLKEIANTLSYYKINSLQLYCEDAFTFKELEGVVTPECALTPEEILELDAYCRERFIDLIPSMATFGHLFTLLQSDRYSYISELPDHTLSRHYWLERQWHHTVNVYHPDTFKVIKSMIEQYLPLFSSKYFNICCDETMDLCCGANDGRDKGEAFFHHVNKLTELVSSYGKTVMLWGDECMAHPDEARENLPEDAIVLNWCYRREVNEWIPKVFWERGFSQIACTGTSSWDNFIENIFISTGNIQSFAAHAKKYGALGILNTNWGDFGHVCSFSCNLYGLLFGAQKSWNVDAPTDEAFEKVASLLLYDVSEFNMADTLRAAARASMGFNWTRFMMWYSAVVVEKKDMPLRFGGHPEHPRLEGDVIESISILKKEREKLEGLKCRDSVITDLILAFRALELMNRELLYVNDAEGYGDKDALQGDFDTWFSDYSKAWLRDNKPSGLNRIREVIESITDVPKNKKD